jgi:hypothetical protein
MFVLPVIAAGVTIGCWHVEAVSLGQSPSDDSDVGSDSDDSTGGDTDGDADSDTDADTDSGDTGSDDPPSGECAAGEYPGDFEAQSPDDLAALTGFTLVEGDLTIVNWFGPFEQEHIECLTSVEGKLQIYDNGPDFSDLDGFEALIEIGGALRIHNNEYLEDIDGLSALDTVGGVLFIGHNNNLESILGLVALEAVGPSVEIVDNDDLPTCHATVLVEQLEAEGWTGEVCIEWNDDDGCEDDTSDC